MLYDDVPHGDDLHRFPAGHIRANFSSNVWPYGMSEGLADALAKSLGAVGSYPPPHAETVRQHLGEALGLGADAVMALNGAVEGIYLVAQAFAGQQSHVVVPTFGEYERACLLNGHHVHFVHEEAFAASQQLPQGLWWLCNPNNPTGKIYSAAWLDQLVGDNPQCMFVVDEAYISLSPKSQSLLPVLTRHRNLLVLVSLTKSYAMPGIRAGYLAAHPDLVRRVSAFQPPWSVGVPALAAIGYAVENRPFDHSSLVGYLADSKQLQRTIASIDGCRVTPSDLGFFLVDTPLPASTLKKELAVKHGILVRDASSFRSLDPSTLRIATQRPEMNRLLVEALCKVVERKNIIKTHNNR